MNKRFVVILMLVFFLSIFKSLGDLTTDLQHYYNFTDVAKDSAGGTQCTITGASHVSSCGLGMGGCFYFDGTNDLIDCSGNERLYKAEDSTFCVWVNGTNDAWKTSFSEGCSGDDDCIYSIRNDNDGDSKPQLYVRNDVGTVLVNQDELVNEVHNSTFVYLCFVKDNTNRYTFFVDSKNDSTGSYTAGQIGGVWNTMVLGALKRVSTVHYYKGQLDEFAIWNRTLTESEISQLYNSGSGCNPINNPSGCGGAPPGNNPSMTLSIDLVNSTKNYNVEFLQINYSASFSDNTRDDGNCTLFVDYLANMTDSDVNLSIIQDFNYSFPDDTQAWVNFQINCSNFESNDSTSVYFYNVDTVLPGITTSYVNNSRYNDTDTFTVNNTVSDPNIFAYNITFINQSDVVLKNIFADNLEGSSASNYSSFTLNSSWIGNNTMRIEAWDSHTSAILKNKPEKDKNGIYYKNVKFYCDNAEDYSFTLEKDRVKPKVYFKENTKNISCYYESNNLIEVRNSNYLFHYVDLGEKIWIDETNPDYKLVKDGKKLRVTYEKIKKKKEFEFNSLGDLNYNVVSYTIDVQDTPEVDLDTALLTSIDNTLDEILGVINLIPIVMLYFGLMFLGYKMITTGNAISGGLLWLSSFGFDFLLVAELFNTYSSNVAATTRGVLTWVFLAFLFVMIFVKFTSFMLLRGSKNSLM